MAANRVTASVAEKWAVDGRPRRLRQSMTTWVRVLSLHWQSSVAVASTEAAANWIRS